MLIPPLLIHRSKLANLNKLNMLPMKARHKSRQYLSTRTLQDGKTTWWDCLKTNQRNWISLHDIRAYTFVQCRAQGPQTGPNAHPFFCRDLWTQKRLYLPTLLDCHSELAFHCSSITGQEVRRSNVNMLFHRNDSIGVVVLPKLFEAHYVGQEQF